MKGKKHNGEEGALKGENSRKSTMDEAHSEKEGFKHGGATHHEEKKDKKKSGGKVEGKKAHKRGDKKMRKGKFKDGGKVESEAGKQKDRPGFANDVIDKDDD
jgi:hypothetical protein